MRKTLLLLLVFVLSLTVAACGSKDKPSTSTTNDKESKKEIEVDTIEITDAGTPIIEFAVPKDNAFEVPEAALGMVIKNGDFGIKFNLVSQNKYVDGSAVSSSFQEMIDYRKEATSHTFYEVSYSDMNGYAQDYKSGFILLYFPIEDSLQSSLETPRVLEVTLSHKGDETKMADEFKESNEALNDFIATDEVQMILNSIKLLPGKTS